MSHALLPVVEAALFTLGCFAIHALRRHADAVTAALTCLATLLMLMVGMACAPDSFDRSRAGGIDGFTRPDPSLY